MQHAHLLGRSAGNHLKDDGRIVGHVELDADPFEIAGQFRLAGFQLHRRHIDGMGIQASQGLRDGGFRHRLVVDRVHIFVADGLQDEIQFLPSGVRHPDLPGGTHRIDRHRKQDADHDAQQGDRQGI